MAAATATAAAVAVAASSCPAPSRGLRCAKTILVPSAAASSRGRLGYGSSYARRWQCRRWAHRPDAPTTRIRRPTARRTAVVRVTCAYSPGAETITACSWNEYVICSDVPVLIEFWASWCGPCRMVTRIVDEIAQEYAGRIKCYKLDTDDYPQTWTVAGHTFMHDMHQASFCGYGRMNVYWMISLMSPISVHSCSALNSLRPQQKLTRSRLIMSVSA